MNGFLWLGVICTLVLIVGVVFDSADGILDSVDLGPSWFSLPVVAAFLGAFGFGTGAFVGLSGAVALVPGTAAGVVVAWIALRLTRAARSMDTGVTETEEAMVGSLGRIVIAPTGERTGVVLLDRPTGPLRVACTADSPMSAGEEVLVVRVGSATLVHVESFAANFGPPPHDSTQQGSTPP